MRRLILLALACAIGAASACSRPAGTLDAATESLGAATLQSIEYSGTGIGSSSARPLDQRCHGRSST